MPAWNSLLTLLPRGYPLAFSGALALSLGLGALWAECPTTTSRPQRPQSQDGRKLAARFLDDLAFQTLARPYFCPDQTPRHFKFTAASLRELASGTWLALNNSSMAAISGVRLLRR